MGSRFISKFPFPLYLFIFILSIGSAKPAQALEECYNSIPVVLSGAVSDPSGIDWSTLAITVNGATPEGVFTNTLTGEWTATFSSAQVVEGTNVLAVSVVDDCGSGNYSSTTRSFRVDTIPPIVIITSPTDGMCLTTGSIIITGSYSNGDTTCEERLDFGPWQPCGTGFFSIPDGFHIYEIRVTDSCGNSGTDSVSFMVDSMETVVDITSPVSGECISTSVVVVDGSVFETGSGVAFITVQAGAYTATGTSFPIILDIPVDGLYDITAQAMDYCGNVGLDSVSNVQLDTIPPWVSITSPVTGQCISTSVVVVNGSITENGSGVDLITVQAGVYTATGSSFPISLIIPVDGLYDITVQVQDNCGNIGPVDTVANVRVDTIPPFVEITYPLDGQTFCTGSIIISGSYENGDSICEERLDFWPWQPYGTGFPPIPDGPHTIQLRVTDSCGNSGTDSVSFIVDGTPPIVNITQPNDGTAIYSSTVVVKGTASDSTSGLSLVCINLDGVTHIADLSGGNWSYTFYGVTNGIHTIVVTAFDYCGYSGSDSVTVSIVHENVSIAYPVNGSCIDTGMIVATGSYENFTNLSWVTVTVTLDGNPVPATTDGAGNWSATPRIGSSEPGTLFDSGGFEDGTLDGFSCVSGICDITTSTTYTTVDWGVDNGDYDIELYKKSPMYTEVIDASMFLGLSVCIDVGFREISDADDILLIEAMCNSIVQLTCTVGNTDTGGVSDCDGSANQDQFRKVCFDLPATLDYCANVEVLLVNQSNAMIELIGVDNFVITYAAAVIGPLTEGPYELTVTASEATAGQSDTEVSNFSVDYSDPTVDLDQLATCYASGTMTVTANCADSGSGVDSCEVTIDNGEDWFASPHTYFGLPTGSYTAVGLVYDNCGKANVSWKNFDVDPVEPVVNIVSPVPGECISSSVLVVDGSITEEGTGIALITVGAGVYSSTGTSFPITLNIPVDGVYDITVQAEDNCGNIGLDTVANVQIDTVAMVSIISPLDGDCINNSAVIVDGSVFETGSGVAFITVQAGAYTATGTSFPIILNIPVDGIHNITVWIEDNCGNIGQDTVANVQIDTAAMVSISYPIDGEMIATGDITVTGTADTDIIIVAVISDQGHFELSGVDPEGKWSVVLMEVVNVPSIFVAAVGTDDCDNMGSDSVTVPVILPTCSISSIGPTTGCPGDAIAIAGTNFGETAGSVSFDATSAVVISWGDTSIVVEAPGGDYSNFRVTPAVGNLCILSGYYSYDNESPTGLVASPAGGSYCATSVTLSCDNPGSTILYTIDGSGPTTASPIYVGPIDISEDTTLKFIAVDTCGNQSGTVTEVYDIDTEAEVTVTSPVDGETAIIGYLKVTGTADIDIAMVIVFSDQGHFELAAVDPGGNWSVFLRGVAKPYITISALGMDECGNTGSDSVTLPVTSPVSIITSIYPESGIAGINVSISGINFGASQGGSTINLGDTEILPDDIILWSDKKIIFKVPADAIFGPSVLTVAIGGLSTCGHTFTV
ncbi:MAG: chitobiase/beta-hexosaminidase C-terminal domain-containing protein, partial [Deltaproteobacteria bacterium]